MSKSVKIQDSPKFKAFKENFEATMDAMEKDPEFAQMKLPEEWERDFKETMEATWEEERQRKKKRIGKRIAIAAGVTLVTLAGLNLGVQQVQGEGLVEFFQRTFNLGGKQYTTVDAGEDVGFQVDENEEEIIFSCTSLSEAYEDLREEIKTSMLQVTYLPENCEIEEAKFDKFYDLFNVKLSCNEEYIYIYQQQQIKEIGQGYITEDEICDTAYNEKLEINIPIYRSLQDNSYSFSVNYRNMVLVVRCNVSVQECVKIAENIVID